MNVADVLAGIPGWEHSAVTDLDGGITNATLLVDNGTERAVLKLDAEPRRAPFNTRVEEARIQALAATRGLANGVLFSTDTVLLTQYVDGEVWTRAAFDDPERLTAFAQILREVHALPRSGRVFDAPAAARDYAQIIVDIGSATMREPLDVVENTPPPPRLRLCHNDLVAENVLSTPAIRLLDWEYACDNDPFFDLATIVAHHDLGEPEASLFLDAYCGGASDDDRQRLVTYCKVYESLLWLWEEAQGIAASNRTNI